MNIVDIEHKKLKEKCVDCGVPLIQLVGLDRNLIKYLETRSHEIGERWDELASHRTVVCPKCDHAYDSEFKKMKIKVAVVA